MKLLVLMNHTITDKQKEVANKMGITEFIYLPDELKKRYEQINPEGSIDRRLVDDIVKFINDKTIEGDYCLIQGEFGITFMLVDYCLKNNRIPVYATTTREYEEKINPDGKIEMKHRFNFYGFRRYEYY